jgi:hypothetical protein
MTLLVGIVGKPSSGKSTFLNAACLTEAEVSELPFTTIEPNKGVGYVKTECLCKKLNVEDNPQNSYCIDGIRFIPINLLDVAGLVPGAHEGKGLGNQFLNDLSRADVLIHIVDITGSLNENGQRIGEGKHDPYQDIMFLEQEIDLWFKDILMREDWKVFTRTYQKDKREFINALGDRLSGLKITKRDVKIALKESNLRNKNPNLWSHEDILLFSTNLRKISKPIVIIANKIDKQVGFKNYKRLVNKYKGNIIPCSALTEFILRKYNEKKIIKYISGSADFKVLKPEKLNFKERDILQKVRERLFKPFGGTGIQKVFQYIIFDLMNQICVYPVSDVNKLTDNKGNVLPDVFLIEKGTLLKDFVRKKIHSELADNFLYGIDAMSRKRLGENYILQNNDIIKIVSTSK